MNEENWYSEENATFGDRLVAAREAAGMSQKDLARRLGVKDKTLKAWENDASEPRANKLQMLAGVLNVSIMWLLSGQGDGLEAPGGPAIAPEADKLLRELRALKVDMVQNAERLARLEKALRGVMADG